MSEFNIYRIVRRKAGSEDEWKATGRQLYLNKENAEWTLERVEKATEFWHGEAATYEPSEYRIEYQTVYPDDWSEA